MTYFTEQIIYLESRDKHAVPLHYYGDIVRRFLFAAALIMLFGAAFFSDELPGGYWNAGTYASVIFATLVFTVIAGLNAPLSRTVAVINMLVSIAGTVISEVFMVAAFFRFESLGDAAFIGVNAVLGGVFLAALYYSIKTFRGMLALNSVHRRIDEVLGRHKRSENDLREIFWDLVGGGASEFVAARVITDPELLDIYLQLEHDGKRSRRDIVQTLKTEFAL